MPRIRTSTSDPLDFCQAHFPGPAVAALRYAAAGDGPDGRGNRYAFDDDHPAYEGEAYRCAHSGCGRELTAADDDGPVRGDPGSRRKALADAAISFSPFNLGRPLILLVERDGHDRRLHGLYVGPPGMTEKALRSAVDATLDFVSSTYKDWNYDDIRGELGLAGIVLVAHQVWNEEEAMHGRDPFAHDSDFDKPPE